MATPPSRGLARAARQHDTYSPSDLSTMEFANKVASAMTPTSQDSLVWGAEER
jgi:hypothetical protein